jgi:hypothetical protein
MFAVVQCHELIMGERCAPCRNHVKCYCSIIKKYVQIPCVNFQGQGFLQFIDSSSKLHQLSLRRKNLDRIFVLDEVYCPTDFLSVQTRTIYYNNYLTKKFFCSCSFDKEDVSPFNTCPKMWNASSEPSTTEPSCPTPQICPECPKNIRTLSAQACKNNEENESLRRLIWMVGALLLVVIISQALILFIIVRVVVKRIENPNPITLNNICPVQEDADISVENDLYGRL